MTVLSTKYLLEKIPIPLGVIFGVAIFSLGDFLAIVCWKTIS